MAAGQKTVYLVIGCALGQINSTAALKKTASLRAAVQCARSVRHLGYEARVVQAVEPCARRTRKYIMAMNIGGEVCVIFRPSPLSLHSLVACDVDDVTGKMVRPKSDPEFTLLMHTMYPAVHREMST